MAEVINVRFRMTGKNYYFSPAGLMIRKGDGVIVETARGVEFGQVTSDIIDVDESRIVAPLKSVIRIATEEDRQTEAKNREREKEAYRVCQEKIQKHKLEMKLIQAEYTFDGNKLLFYFTADGRIDFRELVKDLASVFRTRIELRQIGVRDETKILGGYGSCGRVLCCHSYLSDFSPVSIRMAKEQNLSLNPTKISGVCGRLMCCLQNENETYEYLNRHLPGIGDPVTTAEGEEGIVSDVNVLRQRVKILFDNGEEKEIREYPAEELTFTPRKRRSNQKKKSREKLLQGSGAGKENASQKGAQKDAQKEAQREAQKDTAKDQEARERNAGNEGKDGAGSDRPKNSRRRDRRNRGSKGGQEESGS